MGTGKIGDLSDAELSDLYSYHLFYVAGTANSVLHTCSHLILIITLLYYRDGFVKEAIET